MLEKTIKPDPVVIAGMGPGGLVSAIQLAQKGVPVTIIEPRQEFIRPQRVLFDFKQYYALTQMTQGDPVLSQLEAELLTPKVKSVQNKLFIRVDHLQKYLHAVLQHLQQQHPERVDLKYGKILDIDPTSKQVTIQENGKTQSQSIRFSQYCAADGARRDNARLLNQHLDKNQKIQLELIGHRAHTESGTASLGLADAQTNPLTQTQLDNLDKKAAEFNESHIPRLKALGWDVGDPSKPHYPKFYMFRNEKKSKFFVSGEIPKPIMKIKNEAERKARLEEWAKFLMHVQYGIDEDKLALRQKAGTPSEKYSPKTLEQQDKLRATAFELEIHCCDKASVSLGDGGHFALIGDAFRNANFFHGHGLNDAIEEGIKFAESIEIGKSGQAEFDNKAFNKHMQKRKQALTKMTDIIQNPHHVMMPLEMTQPPSGEMKSAMEAYDTAKENYENAPSPIALIQTMECELLITDLRIEEAGKHKQPGDPSLMGALQQDSEYLKKTISLYKKYMSINEMAAKPSLSHTELNVLKTLIDQCPRVVEFDKVNLAMRTLYREGKIKAISGTLQEMVFNPKLAQTGRRSLLKGSRAPLSPKAITLEELPTDEQVIKVGSNQRKR